MQLSINEHDDVIFISVQGKINSTTVGELTPVLDAITSRTRRVVFDFQNLEYITSAGLRLVLQIKKALPPDAVVEIRDANQLVVDTFRQTRFDLFVELGDASEPAGAVSVKDLFVLQVKKRADKPFVAGEEEFTYGEIDRSSQMLATKLFVAGVHKGTHVGLYGFNNVNWIVAFFAIQKCGAIVLPLNYNYTADDLVDLSHIGDITHICVGDAQAAEDFDEFEARITDKETSLIRQVIDIRSDVDFSPSDDEYEMVAEQFRVPLEAEDDCCMLFTSGSTGKPKAVLHSSDSILHAAQCAVNATRLTDEDRVCMNVPFFHTLGLIRCFLASLIAGAKIELPQSFDTAELTSFVESRKCTIMNAIPTTLVSMVNEPSFSEDKVASIRCSILVGAPVTETQMHMLIAQFPNDHFITSYGMSELSPITISEYGDTVEHICRTAGKVADGVEVEIRDFDTGEVIESSAARKGEIVVRGTSAMTAYYKLPADSQALDRDGWIRTGDFGFFDEESYLHISGRIKELIHCSEQTIEPNEVGSAITAYRAISDVKVLGVPDEKLGERVVACISLRKDEAFDQDELAKMLADCLDAYKLPSDYLVYDKLPTLANGKVDAVSLKADAIKRLAERSA